MASRLDFEPGINAARKREEVERAKRNYGQEQKRAIRLANRGYREGMRNGDYAQAAKAYEFGQQHAGRSGAGITSSGVQERAISDGWDQTNSQLDNFNGQRQAGDGRTVNGDNPQQTEQGPVSAAMRNSNASFSATGDARRREIELEGGFGSAAQARAEKAQALPGKQSLFGEMQQSLADGTDMKRKEEFASRALELGVSPDAFRDTMYKMQYDDFTKDAPSAVASTQEAPQGRALAEQNISTMGQAGAFTDYFKRSQIERDKSLGNKLASENNIYQSPVSPPASSMRPERTSALRPVSDVMTNYDSNEAARITTRDKGYTDSRSFREAAVAQADVAYRTQRNAQFDRFNTIIDDNADTARRKESFLGNIYLENTKPSPPALPPMDYKNFDPSAHPAPPTLRELDAMEVDQNKRWDSVVGRLAKTTLGDAIRRDAIPVLKPLEEPGYKAIDVGIDVYDGVSNRLDKTLNSAKGSIKSAKEAILSTRGAGRRLAKGWLIDNGSKNVSDYFRRQLEEEKKAKKNKEKR